MCPKLSKDKEALDYRKYSDDLARLFEATANLLEREWPQRYKYIDSARTIFFQSVRIAINTYYTIMFIAADIPKGSTPQARLRSISSTTNTNSV